MTKGLAGLAAAAMVLLKAGVRQCAREELNKSGAKVRCDVTSDKPSLDFNQATGGVLVRKLSYFHTKTLTFWCDGCVPRDAMGVVLDGFIELVQTPVTESAVPVAPAEVAPVAPQPAPKPIVEPAAEVEIVPPPTQEPKKPTQELQERKPRELNTAEKLHRECLVKGLEKDTLKPAKDGKCSLGCGFPAHTGFLVHYGTRLPLCKLGSRTLNDLRREMVRSKKRPGFGVFRDEAAYARWLDQQAEHEKQAELALEQMKRALNDEQGFVCISREDVCKVKGCEKHSRGHLIFFTPSREFNGETYELCRDHHRAGWTIRKNLMSEARRREEEGEEANGLPWPWFRMYNSHEQYETDQAEYRARRAEQDEDRARAESERQRLKEEKAAAKAKKKAEAQAEADKKAAEEAAAAKAEAEELKRLEAEIKAEADKKAAEEAAFEAELAEEAAEKAKADAEAATELEAEEKAAEIAEIDAQLAEHDPEEAAAVAAEIAEITAAEDAAETTEIERMLKEEASTKADDD